jgi:hypothetical protein
MIKRERVTKRRVIQNIEWGAFLHIGDREVAKYIKRYKNEGNEYDEHDIYCVLRFHKWLIDLHNEQQEVGMPNGTGLPSIQYWGKSL